VTDVRGLVPQNIQVTLKWETYENKTLGCYKHVTIIILARIPSPPLSCGTCHVYIFPYDRDKFEKKSLKLKLPFIANSSPWLRNSTRPKPQRKRREKEKRMMIIKRKL
jgi:hypothetical protein